MTTYLTQNEGKILLKTARNAIEGHFDNILPEIHLPELPPKLRENGASFVTLTKDGVLRGCVGSIEAVKPLILDVRDRAVAAAFNDFRFPALKRDELNQIKIEISCLTTPVKVQYNTPEELPNCIQPQVDGVILGYGGRRATFLPQVWEKLPTPELFLSRLCLKMGQDSSLWREVVLDLFTYQVEKFSEG